MRTNLILLTIAVILAVPCWLTLAAERTEDFRSDDDIPMLFPGFSSGLVNVVEIRRRRSQELIDAQKLPRERQFEGIVFERKGDDWILITSELQGLKMDPDLIERDVLEHVEALRLDQETLVPTELVDDAFRNSQELTEDTGITVTCHGLAPGRDANGQPIRPKLAELILGKSTKGGRTGQEAVAGYYVCRPDNPKEVIVYEPRSQLWHLSIRPSDWAQKTIHEFALSEVETFYFKNVFGRVAFRRQKGAEKDWTLVPEDSDLKDAGAVIQMRVTELVEKFKLIKAEGFRRRKIPEDAAGVEVEVRATLKDGTEYVLRVDATPSDAAPTTQATSSNHDFKFDIADFYVEPYRRQNPKDLFTPK